MRMVDAARGCLSRGKAKLIFVTRHALGVPSEILDPLDPSAYQQWIKKNESVTEYESLKYRPLISVLVPVYNVQGKFLKKCLDSILAQKYDNFEIIVVDDASSNRRTISTLKKYEKNPKVKILYREKNGHISRATNDALKEAKGEFVALMDDDDEIPENALYEVVKVLNGNKNLDFIYTDEDKITKRGKRFDPNFKSDWAPESFYSSNYISHLGVIRKSIVDETGGFRVGFEGAQDYDLYLRVLEKTDKIYHVPKILYHWRAIPGSTAAKIGNKNYAIKRGKKALEDALGRRGIEANVKVAKNVPYYNVFYEMRKEPLISIIIPTRDQAEITKQCLDSIYQKTTYKNFEVILVNNGSKEQETLDLFKKYKKKYKNFRVLDEDIEFNYSKLNNLAVKESKGEYIVLLNNDTEVLTPNWLEIMMGYASQKHIGAVGVQLAFPDKKIQHAGVVTGLGGVAGHVLIDKNLDDAVWGGRLSAPYNYSAVTAACLMISRKKWNEVGGLEEGLKVAYNDVDFCLKLLEKGYYNVCVPMVKLYHYESRSRGSDETPEKKARVEQERKFMYKKWEGKIEKDRFYNPNYSLKRDYYLDY